VRRMVGRCGSGKIGQPGRTEALLLGWSEACWCLQRISHRL